MIVTESHGHNQEEYFGEGAFVPYQKALWDLFEKPQGGMAAKVNLFNLFKLLEYVIPFFCLLVIDIRNLPKLRA